MDFNKNKTFTIHDVDKSYMMSYQPFTEGLAVGSFCRKSKPGPGKPPSPC